MRNLTNTQQKQCVSLRTMIIYNWLNGKSTNHIWENVKSNIKQQKTASELITKIIYWYYWKSIESHFERMRNLTNINNKKQLVSLMSIIIYWLNGYDENQ